MSKVCIAMNVYKGAEWLERVSIPSVLRQSYEDWSLVIINDGPVIDDTYKVLKMVGGRHCYFSTVPRTGEDGPFPIGSLGWNVAGVNAANHALDQISLIFPECEAVFHLDQDDSWGESHIETGLNVLRENPNAPLVYGSASCHFQDRHTCDIGGVFDADRLRQGNNVIHSSIAFRPSSLRYSSDSSLPADYRFHLAHLEKGNSVWTGKMTCNYFQQCSVEYAEKKR